MASEFQENVVLACQDCGSSTNPTSSYAVEEKSRKRLCIECVEKNTNVVLDPEPDRWMCDQHEDQPITLFCVTCQTNACTKCVHSTHKCHELDDIEKVNDDLQKAKHDKMASESSKNACNVNKLAAECDEKIEMRKKLEQKCHEARDSAREHYRQRKERIDAEFDERTNRLNYIRDKRLAEENAEEEEVATLIERERLQTTAKIIETNLASKNCFRFDSLVDNDTNHLRECNVRDMNKIGYALFSIGTYLFSIGTYLCLLSKFLLSHSACPKGPEDYSQKRTSTLLFNIIHHMFGVICVSLLFAVFDVFWLDWIFGFLYIDYIPLRLITHYNYSTKMCITLVFSCFVFMPSMFLGCCHNCAVFLELILEFSKRFEPELGVVGKVCSALVAMCSYMVSSKKRSDIEQIFIKSSVWGAPISPMNRWTKQFVLRYVIGSIISFVHIRCFYTQIDGIFPRYLFWHPIILCLVTLTDRPWSLLLANALFYLLF